MMKKKKVLLYPAGTEIAFEINNALKYSKFIEIYAASSVSCHAEYVFKNYIDGLPPANDLSCVEALNEVVDKYKIDFIYPTHDNALMLLTENKEKLHAQLVTSDLKTVQICRSKKKTYDFFAGEFFVPIVYDGANSINSYPVFVKPSVSQGSIGAIKVNNKNELETVMNKSGKENIVCEYLPGKEYTVDCFTDKNKKLRLCHLRSRDRIKAGISIRSTLMKTDDEVMKIAEMINSKLSFNGAWFFQLKKDKNGNYKLLEISPRIPGTMAVSRNLGINYPLLTIYNLMDYDLELIENNYNVVLDRAFINRYKLNIVYDRVFIDFDDTVYIDNKINIQLMMFLYQCVNNNKEIILLTKHIGDIYEYLHKYKISMSLFNEIIQIGKYDNKEDYVTSNSIYIDDSFAERKAIKEKFDIPVFDLDMVESLIDWRM